MTTETKPKVIKNVHAAIAQMMAARFKSLVFKNKKQMVDYKTDLNQQIDAVIKERADGWAATKAKSAEAKARRVAAQGEIRGRWAITQLKPGDQIKVSKKKDAYVVVLVEPDRIAVRLAPPKETLGVAGAEFFNPVDVEKILHEGKWLDIYNLASGM